MLNSKEAQILERLIYASEHDPSMPTFPVTRTRPITIADFSNVLLKDESTNPTGTHKDRMAWEIVMAYKDMLLQKQNDGRKEPLPHLSIISAGSAALAIQSQLRKYDLPDLNVLIDNETDPRTLEYLAQIGTIIHRADLHARKLTSRDILQLTDNANGFDITSNKGFDPDGRFYDWLAYEILNENPDYVFMPSGTFQLYENVLGIAKKIATDRPATIYSGDKTRIPNTQFIAATTNNPTSKAVKLYAPFRPFTDAGPDWLRLYAWRGWCGEASQIIDIQENQLDYAYGLLQDQGVILEPSAAAGLAAMLQLQDISLQDARDAKMLVVSTGRARFPTNPR
jgi:hypothetical protein